MITNNEEKNIICVPFAFKRDSCSGLNIEGDVFQVYLKNACVSLYTAKYYNSKCEVVLATNIELELLPKEYVNLLKNRGIKIITIPFDCFVFRNDYLWMLAFYKLCVLKHLANENYNKICYVDTDVYFQDSIDNIWEECENNILMYDINHGLQAEDYRIITREINQFLRKDGFVTHYGGEFFAANRNDAKVFVEECEKVYKQMLTTNYITTKGDEFILSICASSLKQKIKNAGRIFLDFGPARRLGWFLRAINIIRYVSYIFLTKRTEEWLDYITSIYKIMLYQKMK